MYCPSCRSEYRPGFTECSDCGVDLVHNLPPEQSAGQPLTQEEEEQAGLVKIYSTYSQSDVMMVKACLDAEEIVYNFQGELFGGSGIFITPATLYVPRADADRVRQMLKDHGIK